MFTNYSYERVQVTEISARLHRSAGAGAQPVSARFAAHRRRRRADHQQGGSEHHPQYRRQPDHADDRQALHLVGGPGRARREHQLLQAGASRAWCTGSRTTACRSAIAPSWEYIHSFSGSKELPIFEKLFLGGEYSVRGFDIRTIGPQDPSTGLVLGGNKSLLFNIEELIGIAGPVRLVLFYDAGQVQSGPVLLGPWRVHAARRVLREHPCARQELQPAGLQDVHRRRDPVLHAGVERAVPPHLCLSTRGAKACWTTRCNRRKRSSSGLPSGRPSR